MLALLATSIQVPNEGRRALFLDSLIGGSFHKDNTLLSGIAGDIKEEERADGATFRDAQ